MNEPAISLVDVSKRYVYRESGGQRLARLFSDKSKNQIETYALKNVSLEIPKGQSLGILGANGAGKSTLLQIIGGIILPSSGNVDVSGSLGLMLELGAGFNPEFSGRENTTIYCSLQGLKGQELRDSVEAIHQFSEIGASFDRPMKTYSSGMFMRVAFSASILAKPEILIVDEALSVGDIYFQLKCEKKVREFIEQGGTFVLVAHSTNTVLNLCNSVLILDKGELLYHGDVKKGIDLYLQTMFPKEESSGTEDEVITEQANHYHLQYGYNPDEMRVGSREAEVVDFVFHGSRGVPSVLSGNKVGFTVSYSFLKDLDDVIFGYMLRDQQGLVISARNTNYSGDRFSFNNGEIVRVNFEFFANVVPGLYLLTFGVSKISGQEGEVVPLDRRLDSVVLIVESDMQFVSDGIAQLQATIKVME
jgi:ABC-type polysaccharide/polyol phosphate transport system ATPase subunit